MIAYSSAAFAEQPLRFATEEYPPFNFTDPKGALVGMSTDILFEAAKRADVKVSFEIMPWVRAYSEALNKPDACAFSTTMTDERRDLFQWVTPLVRNDWAIFARTGDYQRVSSLDDLKGKRIGVYQGGAIETFLQRETGFVLEAAVRDDLNPLRLSKGEIDIRPSFTFREVELGLACNRIVPKQKIVALQAALKSMGEEGLIENIQARYLLEF
jgi:polar amino acid transport system substrate-binding protein